MVQGGTLTDPDVQTATGSETELDFSVPDWAKRITLSFVGLTRDETTPVIARIGGAGGISATDYVCNRTRFNASSVVNNAFTEGAHVNSSIDLVSNEIHGDMTLTLSDTDVWQFRGVSTSADVSNLSAGSKDLGEQITTVRITTVTGTAGLNGLVSAMYE